MKTTISTGNIGNKLETAKRSFGAERVIMMDQEAWVTAEMICTGVLAPIEGFMNCENYKSVLEIGRLSDGTIFPVPITFAPSGKKNADILREIKEGERVILVNTEKEPIAILTADQKFEYDKEERASKVFGTTDRSHPGVRSIYERMGKASLAGKLELIKESHWGPFESYRMNIQKIRNIIEEVGAKKVVGFITGANPPHRGHEHIHKMILEDTDLLLVGLLVEMTKPEYIRPEFRIKAYEILIDEYYPTDDKGMPRTIMFPLRVTYIFAGPREALLHAIIMKNYGCTHFAIGRDHAGVGDYYGKYDAQKLFDEYPDLGIKPIFFREVFYCTRCNSTATERTCPHGEEYRIKITGTGIRDLMRYGYIPPKEIVRPEVSFITIQGIQPKGTDKDGLALYSPGEDIKKLFPFYLNVERIGGKSRDEEIALDDLTIKDLEMALKDARENANKVYQDIYDEVLGLADIKRDLVSETMTTAREDLLKVQEQLIELLGKKLSHAPESLPPGELRYQDKREAIRELGVATYIYENMPRPLTEEYSKKRVWLDKKYELFRG